MFHNEVDTFKYQKLTRLIIFGEISTQIEYYFLLFNTI